MTAVSQDVSLLTDSLTSLDAKLLWKPSTPTAVKAAWKERDLDAAWDAWCEHLTLREPPVDFSLSLSGSEKKQTSRPLEPLAWGALDNEQGFPAWLDQLEKGLAGKRRSAQLEAEAAEWAAESASRKPSIRFALEAIAWAHALPRFDACDHTTWWALCDALASIAREATRSAAPSTDDPSIVVTQQLLAGELALTLCELFPEMLPLRELGTKASEVLGEGLLRLTDGEGLLQSKLIAAAHFSESAVDAPSLLLACWTRCHAMGGKKRGPWSSDAELQFEWLVRQTLRLVDRQGRFPFGATTPNLALLEAALMRGGDDADEASAAKRLKLRSADGDASETPSPANHSEWSELGVLAAGWREKAPRIVVAHPGDAMAIEVHAGKQTLLSGEWPIDVVCNGQQLVANDDWETQCWHSDADADYLELAITLDGGPHGEMRLERQVLLSREDGVAMLGEILLSEDNPIEAALSINTRLPLGAGLGFAAEKETREGLLVRDKKTAAGVIPISLPEWRDDPRGGELTSAEGALRLTREASGRNLASALWLDFSTTRFAKQRTWRQLTVAQSLEKVGHDVAVGYRVQSGKDQWLVYRSLDRAANRTLLGHNLSSEFIAGRFLSTGEVDEYLEIEAGE